MCSRLARLSSRSLVLCGWLSGTSSEDWEDVSVERQHAGLGRNSDQQELGGQKELHPSVRAKTSLRTWTGKNTGSESRSRLGLEAGV